jgi:GST-like protein
MIDVYLAPTPNGRKIAIFMEEAELPYNLIYVNFRKSEQHAPEYVKLNPNHKIPTIVDPDGPDGEPITIFESGAILLYLAAKTGKLIPQTARGRYEVLQWVMFQMAGVGPMMGQVGHFRNFAPEKIPYAIERYTKEAERLYGVLDLRLSDHEYLVNDYSIADIATWPWINPKNQGQDIEAFPHLKRWIEAVAERPGVQRAQEKMAALRRD